MQTSASVSKTLSVQTTVSPLFAKSQNRILFHEILPTIVADRQLFSYDRSLPVEGWIQSHSELTKNTIT